MIDEKKAQDKARQVDGNMTKAQSLANLKSLPGYGDFDSWEAAAEHRAQQMAAGAWRDKNQNDKNLAEKRKKA